MLVLIALMLIGSSTGFHYEAGYDHHYTYSSTTDTLGMHNVTTILKFRIRLINETDSGIKLHLLTVDSFIQHTQSGHYADNPFKWDLKNIFLFEMQPDGLVNFIHFHPEDKEEMITIKKALVGTMSAKFQISDDQTWSFTSKEKDHGGHLQHNYEGARTNSGYTLNRHHKSDEIAYRTHQKVMHLDHSGSVQKIKAYDNITMKGDIPEKKRTLGTPLPVDRDIKVYTTGEFPGISAIAETHVELTLKRKVSDGTKHTVDGLIRDSIVVTKKPPKRTQLNETGEKIAGLIKCVLSHENKFAPNRTLCVQNLTRAIIQLNEKDFLSFSHIVLKKKCNTSDVRCLDERYLMLDVISQARTNISQEVIVEYVLSRNVSVEEVRRCLIHSIAVKQPIYNLIRAVEQLCFGQDYSFHGSKNMTLTQKRACLTLGALAKNLRDTDNDTEAQRIIDKFETWLGIHNESEFVKIVKPREKRSVGQGKDYRERDSHVALKRTLLHSLGNAAHPRSLKHIASYMELNKVNPELRRTAAHALRHYTCNESAAHLLRSTLFDLEEVVRQGAYEIYMEHPESKQLSIEQENAVLEQRYTYPLITRVRRGTFADILKALSFHLGMPKFDWKKVVGSTKLGASFGLRMENFVDLNLEPFKGNFELKVDNLAFAEVNIGLIGKKYDIFRVSLCYKKKFKYNLNILKDFGFDDIQNLATAFDRLFHKIIDPIVNAVNIIKELIVMVRDMTFVQIVKKIVDLFKHLPEIIMTIVDKVKETFKKLTDFGGFLLVNVFKRLVNRITTFISDIKSDVLEFYHSIADVMTITLPFVAHEMGEGFQLIKDSWKFWENPMESFKGIEMALVKFKLAVATFIEAKNRIMDACFFTKGRTPYWFHPGEEIHGILNDLDEVLRMSGEELKDYFHPKHNTDSTDLSPTLVTDGFNVSGTQNATRLVIQDVVGILKNELLGVLDIARPLWNKISYLMNLFKRIKSAYTGLREGIHKGKYYIQKLFGSKFHRNFPKIPAPCESPSCGCGELRDVNGRRGLHLNFKPKIKRVVNPFHGTVFRISDTEVLVHPVRADLKMYEVVVSGFDVDPDFDEEKTGVFKRAGRRIGRAKDAADCESGSFVFVAMRKRPNNTDTRPRLGDSYYYIDPAPYLKKRFPKLGTHSTCNGFSFYYIGMAAEDGDMTGDAEDDQEDIHRHGDGGHSPPNFGHGRGHHFGRGRRSVEEEPEKERWLQKFKEKFHNMTGKFDKYKNMFSHAVKSFLPKFDINDKSLTFIKHLLQGSSLVDRLDDIVKQVAEKLRTEPIDYPDGMPLHQIRRRLKKAHQFETTAGDRLSMIDKLLENAVHECVSFIDAIIPGYGHYCEAHGDCHGITCGVVFTEGFQRHLVKLDVRLDSCADQLHITVNDKMKTLDLTSQKNVLVVEVSNVQNKELVFDLEINSTDGIIKVSMSGSLCVSTHYSCFEDVDILRELTLDNRNKVCFNKQPQDPYIDRVYSLTLPDLLEEVSEFELDMKHCLILINEIRNATLYALMTKDPSEIPGGDGFPEKEDFCFESGPIALGHVDIEIVSITFLFMVGPIPFHLAFGADARMGVDLNLEMCLMSMKAKAVVTPHIGAIVWGELALDIGIAYGGIRLEGHLLETTFPITAEFGFGKFPINIGFRLDLEIVPLELRLKAFAKVRLLFVTVTVFDACLWKYKLPTYKTNLFNKPYDKKDPNPPRISSAASNPRERRSSPGGCEVKQLEGRDITDTAFLLEVSAKSDVSDIKLSYAIGTHRSGNNVQDWTGMTGNTLTAPVKLKKEHYGIPLFFTIKAKNSQGTEAITECNLKTYDNTVPDGRIDESYPYTSHPHKISGNVVVFEDSTLMDTHYEAVGITNGEQGSDVVPWKTLILKTTSERKTSNVNSPLRFFTIGKEGKLTAEKISSSKTDNEENCAQMCLNFGKKCVAFDYEHHSETCDLKANVEGPKAELRISGTYKNFERLGVGYSSYIEHNLDLKHGVIYFLNAEIRNTLGYKGYVSSHGTMVDFTPPEPGPIGNASVDVMRFDGCKAAITQRCIEITHVPNHRKIVDGKEATTVFNGHEGGVDTLYTLANHFMSANWDGFHDKESAIYGYTWSVGTTICGTDIANFSDPNAHLSSRKFWTNTAYARSLHLPDGPYYVTVQAINNVVHGGAMVTTVCHSTPIMVDTTPPYFTKGISDEDIVFDEDFNLMALYYSTMDPKSKIKSIDFGLGLTKHDVDVRGYSSFEYKEDRPFIVVKDLNLASGEPVWIRLKAKNNVELPTTTHSDNPILIDRTNPVAGHVFDGGVMSEDVQYQSDNSKICAQWKGFYDPESGINEYKWGVGLSSGVDNIVPFRNKTFSRDIKESCAELHLQHNTTYYSTVIAKNSALNPRTVEGHSNGVLIDTTPPVKGWIKDGSDKNHDMKFSSETAEVSSVWGGFSDPESGIVSYTLDVYINNALAQSFENGLKTDFVDYSLSMKHGDSIYVKLTTTNGAETLTVIKSDGFVIDQTPPSVKYLHDTMDGRHYQSDSTKLHLKWKFDDPESGLKEYSFYIEDFYQGQGHKFYPKDQGYVTIPVINNNITADIVLQNLHLESGHKYSVKVTAINHADMPQSQESDGVIIDSTPPVLKKVHLGLPTVPEEISDGFIEHDDQHSMTLTWDTSDFESGIVKSYVAIGTSPEDSSVTSGFVEFGADPKAVINDIILKPATINDSEYYYVQVKVQNGAGMFSEIQNLSLPIKVLKENIPGTVFDGRNDLVDGKFTFDRTSVAMSFVGFESEQCNIVGYEWAIGSQPFYYDVLPFTDYGIVLMNGTYGRGQIHTELYEGSTYYVTVRARTGHRCKEEYILSCSDGLTLDTTPPEIKMVKFGAEKIHPDSITSSLYQNRTDSLDFRWEAKDASGIAKNWWSIGSLPGKHDIHPKTITKENYIPAGSVFFRHGQTFFVNTGAVDKAGNEKAVSSPSITVDTTIPEILDLSCTPYISVLRSLVYCEWGMIKEFESSIKNFTVGVGSHETNTDISLFHKQSIYRRSWTRDLLTRIKHNNLTEIYIIFKLVNKLGMTKTIPYRVIVDRSIPIGGKVDIVTNIELNGPIKKQSCQIPQSFIEFTVNGWKDDQSGIERYEAALGSNGRVSNIKDFLPITNTDKTLITHLNLVDGSEVRVTVRAFNKAGLYGQVISNPVVISLVPHLTVHDGTSGNDEDYQTSLNVIEGRWKYSDRCTIRSAEWSVQDIAGNILQDYLPLPRASTHFYSDILNLTNGRTYINIIKTVDALNRTRISRSDGIAVKIEPPIPGTVRDGDADDLAYQESVQVLSVNWDTFGNDKSRDPTQKIRKYEIAVGTDRRYPKMRANIHYFVNVGLNTSYTFYNLNLTAKTVTYYMTVRAHSYAGSFQEVSSNGIKVGYHDEIYPGIVEHSLVQPYTDKLYVSWSGFQADMGIDKFQIGVSTFEPVQLPNVTLNCKTYDKSLPQFDVVPLNPVGTDTFIEMTNLTLLHGKTYYVSVVAMDTTERCIGSYGPPLMVDTTPPKPGVLHLPGDVGPNVAFVFDPVRLQITWTEFVDPESMVDKYEVKLFSGTTCFDSGKIPSETEYEIYSIIRTREITNDLHTEFYDLKLSSDFTYVVTITATNRAGLETTVRSHPMKLDTTPPIPGTVKVGTDWKSNLKFQSHTDMIKGMMGIAHTEKASKCLRQVQIFPVSDQSIQIQPLDNDFDSKCLVTTGDKLSLFIRHDDQLQQIIKGGIRLSSEKVLEGNYSVIIKAAPGDKMVTSWFLASSFDGIFSDFTFNPPDNDTNVEMKGIAHSTINGKLTTSSDSKVVSTALPQSTTFMEGDTKEYMSGAFDTTTPDGLEENSTLFEETSTLANRTVQYESTSGATMEPTTTHGHKIRRPNDKQGRLAIELKDHYGVGFHIPGYRFEGQWYSYIWIRDKYKTVTRQIALKFDPTTSYNDFVVNLEKVVTPTRTTWSIEVYLNGETIVQFNGIGLKEKGVTGIYTWNKDDYFPPVVDLLDPFIGEAVITSIKIPLPKKDSMKCVHGAAFYDGESNIKELWVGVSDTINNTDSISPMMPYKNFCNLCQPGCNIGCEKACANKRFEDFEIIDLLIGNLSLIPATVDNSDGESGGNQLNATTYYLNIKAVNFAGQETLVQSKGIMVDTTPPDLQYVRCVDPSNSMNEPTNYQGTNSSMGAYWECSEDVGDIVEYVIQIGTQPGKSDIKDPISVGFTKKLKVEGLGDKLKHDNTYYFTVTAVNSAGLTSIDSCNITVEILPPDVSNVTLSYMFSDDEEIEEASLTSEDRDIGLEWDGGKDDVEFYEWEIGSEPETDDVFPRIKVGITESKRAFIKNGKLWIDSTPLNTSVGDFANKSWIDENVPQSRVNTFFHLEPGKCVYVTLYAVGVSHLSSIVQSNPLCVKRKGDTDLQLGTPANSRKRKGGRQHGEIKLLDSSTGVSADIVVKGRNVGVIGGVLNETDVTAEYGSAASYKYTRYLVDPKSRHTDTSRFLRNRLKKYAGLTFYLSPSASVEGLREISISVMFDTKLFDTNTDLPALVYWDKDEQIWKHPHDRCDGVQDSTDFSKGMFITKACKEMFINSKIDTVGRKKRSVKSNIVPVPRMLSLMVMSRRAPNTPPRITTSELFISEDMYNITVFNSGRTIKKFDFVHDINGQGVIQYFDNENDTVEFTIEQAPSHGSANVTSDGTLYYKPDVNFYGVDFIILKATETGLLPPFHPLSVTKNITINVAPMNDAPELLPFESNLKFEEFEKQGKIFINVLLDGNRTKKHDLGYLTFYDADFVDPTINEINFSSKMNNTKLSAYSFDQMKNHGLYKKKFKLSLSLDKSFYGRTVFSVRGFDRDKFTTKTLEVNAYILIAPCIHGNCVNKTSTQCHDIERAVSFSRYVCECYVGYTGEWCQTDINECDPNPCSVFFDCKDLIGYQKCNLNIVKTFLLMLAVLLIIVMCCVLIRHYWRKKHPTKIDPGYNIWTFGIEHLGQTKQKFIRPSSANSTTELIRPASAKEIDVGIGCSTELIRPASAKEIDVGIGCSIEETVDMNTCMSKVQEDPTWQTDNTKNHPNKALEHTSPFIRDIGMAAPHHKSKLVLDRGQLDLTSQSSHVNERKDKGVQSNAGRKDKGVQPHAGRKDKGVQPHAGRKDKGVQPHAGSLKLKLGPMTILQGDQMKTSIKESDDVLKFSRHKPLSPPGYHEMGRKMKGKTGKSLVDHTNWKGRREDINEGRTDVIK